MDRASAADWEHLATFVAVARQGSLTAGARARGISQPTASRHVQALEQALGEPLFVRHARGLSLTDRGAALFAEGREVADRIEGMLRAPATDAGLTGSVRVSAAEPIGVHALAPCFTALRRELPGIGLEVVIDNTPANLSHRQADVAVRMFRPEQLDLVAKRIGEVEVGLFATRSYLERHGVPDGIAHARDHTFIGADRDPTWHRVIRLLGATPADFGYRSDNLLAQVEAVRAGIGIGPMHAALAARHPDLVWVLPELPIPPLEMWLVMHEALRGSAAVRAVFDRIAEALTEYVATPGPEAYC